MILPPNPPRRKKGRPVKMPHTRITFVDRGIHENGTRLVRIGFDNGQTVLVPLADFNMGSRSKLLRGFADMAIFITKETDLTQIAAELYENDFPDKFIQLTKPGWYEPLRGYAGVNNTYGAEWWQIERDFPNINREKFGMRGSLADWKRTIGGMSRDNPLLMLAICCALLGPLLDILGLGPVGFEIFGPPGIGKKTVLKVAGSVWGCDLTAPHRGFIEPLVTDMDGLERIMLAHNDGFVPLDETRALGSDARLPGLMQQVAIRLSEGVEKQRRNSYGPRGGWRAAYLVSAIDPLHELLGSGYDDGYRVRLTGIPADAGRGHGVFQELHGFTSNTRLAENLDVAVSRYFGTPIHEYLRRLTYDRRENNKALRSYLNDAQDEYLHYQEQDAVSLADVRITKKFAPANAANWLGVRYGILPWTAEEGRRAIWQCQLAHLESIANRTFRMDAVAAVRRYIEENLSGFVQIPNPMLTDEEVETLPGVYEVSSDGSIRYGITPRTFDYQFGSLGINRVRRALDQAGLLVYADSSDGRRSTIQRRMPIRSSNDADRKWMYCIRGGILSSITGLNIGGIDATEHPADPSDGAAKRSPTIRSHASPYRLRRILRHRRAHRR